MYLLADFCHIAFYIWRKMHKRLSTELNSNSYITSLSYNHTSDWVTSFKGIWKFQIIFLKGSVLKTYTQCNRQSFSECSFRLQIPIFPVKSDTDGSRIAKTVKLSESCLWTQRPLKIQDPTETAYATWFKLHHSHYTKAAITLPLSLQTRKNPTSSRTQHQKPKNRIKQFHPPDLRHVKVVCHPLLPVQDRHPVHGHLIPLLPVINPGLRGQIVHRLPHIPCCGSNTHLVELRIVVPPALGKRRGSEECGAQGGRHSCNGATKLKHRQRNCRLVLFPPFPYVLRRSSHAPV